MTELHDSESINPAFAENNVPIVFSVNDRYVPILSVALASIIDHASVNHNYDILVLTRGLQSENITKLQSMVADRQNFSLRLVNYKMLSAAELNQAYVTKQVTVETYFRLFIPTILPNYEKIIYMDCDMVALTDVAELMNIDVSNHVLAACKDYVTILTKAYFYQSDGTGYDFIDYIVNELNIDLNLYCNMGLIVFNSKLFKEQIPVSKILQLIPLRSWIAFDQDVFNVLCAGKIKIIDMSWNCISQIYGYQNKLHYCQTKIKEYITALQNPKIIHYAYKEKPWIRLIGSECNFFWYYAQQCPFYEELEKIAAEQCAHYERESIVAAFKRGMGMRVILRSFKEWLKFKLTRHKRRK